MINVVQPDEFDELSFEVVDGKLQPRISPAVDNILEIKPDGLFATAGEPSGVAWRYRYDASFTGEIIHKGIKFDFIVIDGALTGYISGVNFPDITVDDLLLYNGFTTTPTYDDEKYVLEMKWGSEFLQRFILKLYRNAVPELWSVHLTATTDIFTPGNNLIVIIDEMVDVV